jgi:hypothetical protein
MIAVVSQAWTLDDGERAEAYIALSAEFLTLLRQQPGFRGRRQFARVLISSPCPR